MREPNEEFNSLSFMVEVQVNDTQLKYIWLHIYDIFGEFTALGTVCVCVDVAAH